MSKKVSFMQEVKNIIKENEVKQVQFGNLQFHVKQYIPLEEKLIIANLVVQGSYDTHEESGLRTCIYGIKCALKDFFICKFYTNLNIKDTDDWSKIYNYLKHSEIVEVVKKNIPEKELELLNDIIEEAVLEELNLIERQEKITNVIGKFLDEINKNIPKMIEELKNFDPKKLEFIQELNKNLKGKSGIVQ